jgi:hypothetical protein
MSSMPSLEADGVGSSSIKRFILTATSYLQEVSGDISAIYGEDAVTATILHGVRRARTHGIVGQRDVCFYLRVMFSLLGSDFDQDPLYPWASKILAHNRDSPSRKMLLLTKQADTLLDNIRRCEPSYLKKMIAATRVNLFTDLPDTLEEPAMMARVFSGLNQCLPGKVSCVGEENVELLIAQGLRDAKAQGLRRAPHVAAFIQYMFIHGARFYSDPKYPEARMIFSTPAQSADQKIARMFSEARRYLQRKLRTFAAQ